MASQKKTHRLCEIDLAIAAALTGEEQRDFIDRATSGRPYPFYRSAKSLYPAILSVASLALLPSTSTLKKAIAHKCKKGRKGEVPGNQAIAEGLRQYAIAHSVVGVEFEFDPVPLGRAGKRVFWGPFIIQIDGKKYIPFFDPRLTNGLTPEARRFIFSVNDTRIRKQDPTKYGDIGFVIFQFEKIKNESRRVIAYFDRGVELWDDKEISARIDAVYRIMAEIEQKRAA